MVFVKKRFQESHFLQHSFASPPTKPRVAWLSKQDFTINVYLWDQLCEQSSYLDHLFKALVELQQNLKQREKNQTKQRKKPQNKPKP